MVHRLQFPGPCFVGLLPTSFRCYLRDPIFVFMYLVASVLAQTFQIAIWNFGKMSSDGQKPNFTLKMQFVELWLRARSWVAQFVCILSLDLLGTLHVSIIHRIWQWKPVSRLLWLVMVLTGSGLWMAQWFPYISVPHSLLVPQLMLNESFPNPTEVDIYVLT